MNTDYNFREIEPKWQEYWDNIKLFDAPDKSDKQKYYCLMMFPYPSGKLHVGHGRNYIIGDAVTRYMIMKGYNVMNPMGWDSFGLPAENYAIKVGKHPKETTLENISAMKEQMKKWGVGYDWKREVSSSTPEYYKWTQWLFLKLYEKGLAYKKYAPVNWCPGCNTVLANEQVVEGKCERSGDVVIQKDMAQWFYKITDYSERLLADLDLLEEWPERVKTLQKNWIGKSRGCYIDFELKGGCKDAEITDDFPSFGVKKENDKTLLRVFTTRPDTAYGVTFISIAPEHPMLSSLLEDECVSEETKKQVLDFATECKNQTNIERESETLEKKGVFTGRYVKNPLCPEGEDIPIFVANYVLMYGTGIVMAVPAHDQRDFEFAKKHSLNIIQVVRPEDKDSKWNKPVDEWDCAFVDYGVSMNSKEHSELKTEDMKIAVASHLAKINRGGDTTVYRLRDWLLSRQRYWGAPIPIVYCDKCGIVPVPEKELPVLLPENVNFKDRQGNPLESSESFVNTVCPKCGDIGKRETDTMDTFVCSSWYYLRYISPKDETKIFDSDLVNYWLPVDQYIGGIEHATGHLIYSRFFTKVLKDLNLVNFDEPFKRLFTQGMISKDSFWCGNCGFLSEGEYEEISDKEIKCNKCKGGVTSILQKMSKSKYNVVSPDELISKYGADTQRLYTLFIGPPEKDAEWNDRGVIGAFRFLNKLWDFVDSNLEQIKAIQINFGDNPSELVKSIRRKVHQTIKKVTYDISNNFHFNTAISAIMELLNELRSSVDKMTAKDEEKMALKEGVLAILKLSAPMVPHVVEELWSKINPDSESIFYAEWPDFDESIAKEDMIEIAVQVNGKIKDRINIPAAISDEELRKLVLTNEKVSAFIDGREIKKFISVQGRLVNIIV